MKIAGILDRRVRGRLALMGITQREFCEIIEITYMTLRTWFQKPELSVTARETICRGLCVADDWLDSESLEDAGVGLNALCVQRNPLAVCKVE